MDKHRIMADNAAKIRGWFVDRGGIAVWPSVNLSNPGASWTTPALTVEGAPMPKPTWQAANEPRIITDPADVLVDVPKLVKRFHVGVRMGGNGLQLKVTDAGSARIRKALEKAGDGSWYEFDYMAQDALIFAPDMTVPLSEWETVRT